MKLNKLTALQVARAQPGRYGDGGGLALLVSTASMLRRCCARAPR